MTEKQSSILMNQIEVVAIIAGPTVIKVGMWSDLSPTSEDERHRW